MTGWQVQAMLEADAAAEWEQINEPDPHERNYHEAAYSLDEVVKCLDKALDWVMDAYGCVEGLPVYDRLVSYYDMIDDLKSSLNTDKDQLRKGWYE